MKPSWHDRRIYVATTEAEREEIRHVQKVLGLRETGDMDDEFKGHLRGIQKLFGLNVTGILDDATAEQIERIFPYGA